MELHFKKLGSGQPIVILHGLFGSSDNWQTMGKQLAEDYEVYLVDQRNHGHSGHSDVFNYDVLAADLYDFFRENHLYDAILLGHSMGGKTAIRFAQQNPDLLEKLIVADIGIKSYPMHHDTILEALHAVKPNERSGRREAEEIMTQFIQDNGVKQFLLKNLYWKEKGLLDWRFNLKSLEKEMPHILAALPHVQVRVPTLFIRGSESNYILDSDIENIQSQFIDVDIKTIDGAGHWLHAEAPETFYNLLIEFIS